MRWSVPNDRRAASFIFGILFILATGSSAALPLSPPETFFTNLANRLLQQQLGIRLSQIRVAPTNEYSRAVHQIFQVTANIYDAMSTNPTPTVFRPVFVASGTNVLLGGFTNDNDASTIGAWLVANPYEIPPVIAARKGYPTFNEFSVGSDFTVVRKLQLLRASTNAGVLPFVTNQMYLLGWSNLVAVEVWNSYSNSSPPVSVWVSNVCSVSITNRLGLIYSNSYVMTGNTNVVLEGRLASGRGFAMPLRQSQVILTNAAYRFADNSLDDSLSPFEDNSLAPKFPYPEWSFTMSNRLTYISSVNGALIDCVMVSDVITQAVSDDLMRLTVPRTALGGVWNPSRPSPNSPSVGIRAQVDFSMINNGSSDWIDYALPVADRSNAIRQFRDFIAGRSTNLSIVTPFNPVARFIQQKTMQANDPLVHQHRDDLGGGWWLNFLSRSVKRLEQISDQDSPFSLTNINKSYAPWNWSGFSQCCGNQSLEVTDPGLGSSDQWNFPSNEVPRVEWLGRVHRGTPWQSIYLKATAAWTSQWYQNYGSYLSHPTNDWMLAELIASEFVTNRWEDRISINNTSTLAWASALAGLVVYTNVLDDQMIGALLPTFDPVIIQPSDLQIQSVVESMNTARNQQPRHYFSAIASWLQTSGLSTTSPWLNSSPLQVLFGITDEAYEALPSQLLARVRADPIAHVSPSNNHLTATFTGCAPGTYILESSADLQTWTPLVGTHQPTNGTFTTILDGADPALFIRAKLINAAR